MNALANLIFDAARQFASRDAVIGAARSLTFDAVDVESNRLASYLAQSAGLGKGERVAILLHNCPEFVVADFALIKAGLIRVPVNPRYAAPEIEFILQHSGAAALVTSGAFLESIAPLGDALPALRSVIVVDAELGAEQAAMPRTVEWRTALDAGTADPFAVDTTDGDGYMIGYTSGTTGRPKGALTTVHARWANICNCYANEMFVTPDDAMLHVASLAHGSGTKVLPLFAKGATNVLLPKFTPRDFFAMTERHRITISWMVPTIVAMLADASERTAFDTSSLSTIIYGGAPMPEPVLARALAAFGPIFVQIYGLTEAPHPDLVLSKRDHVALAERDTGVERSGSVVTGRIAIGVQLRLLDDAGHDVVPGEVGEIAIAGDHVMTGYWNDRVATSDTLKDGWCLTGDLARVDADGFYTIVDRKKEMIISGGYNVYPREVEDALYRHRNVAECAVVGAPDPVWGETVCAFVVSKEGAIDEAALAEHCARELAGYKKPRRIMFVDALPKTANGKIDKKVLRAHVVPVTTGTQRLSPDDTGFPSSRERQADDTGFPPSRERQRP
jgi:acyl-CoA synthetase (AMP-forming)/AMP-acid ligase II